MHKNKVYSVWADMIQRCTNPNCENYKYYGAKGVTVCDEWRNSFQSFFSHMGNRPTDKHSIDRIIVTGNYEPGNCRWATREEQSRNTRSNRVFEHDGKTMILKDWAVYFNISPPALRGYLLTHSFEEAYSRYSILSKWKKENEERMAKKRFKIKWTK